MTHDQALAALHKGARRILTRLSLVGVLAAAGFGASGIPGDLERGRGLATAVGGAALGALVWGLPMWLFLRYAFAEEHRRVLRVDRLVPAQVVELHHRRLLSVRTEEGTDLVLPIMRGADQLTAGQRV